MNNRDKIIFAILCVITGVIVLTSYCAGQTYQVPNFSGGLNTLDDSLNIAPNQSLYLKNLVLDAPNVLMSRQGYSRLNTVAIDTSEEIDEIYVYEPVSGTKRMVIATNGGVYIAPSLANPGSVNWDTLKMGWDGDSLRVTNASAAIIDLGHNWWYSKMGSNYVKTDSIKIGSTKYIVGVHYLTSRLATLGSAYGGITDTLPYTVYYGTNGTVSFTQSGDKLYICSSDLFPLVYNDTSYVFMALIDSGLVSDTAKLTGEEFYNHGKVHLDATYGALWSGDSSITFTSWDSSWVGRYFTIPNVIGPLRLPWTSIIDKMILISDSSGWRLRTEPQFPFNEIANLSFWNNYEITVPLAICVPDSGAAISDSNKNWNDRTYGFSYLQNFYAVSGDTGYSQGSVPSRIRRIWCNEIESFSTRWIAGVTFSIADEYYIFAGVPFLLDNLDSTYQEAPRFEQIFFYTNQLYGFGYDRVGITNENKVDYNHIWYSEIGESRDAGIMHRYIKPDFNFDVDASEDINVGFQLRGRAYVATDKSIWTFTGSGLTGDLSNDKIISNNGIPDIDNWAKATEEYGYFANYNGVYGFDGVRAVNVSDQIKSTFEHYRNSRIVMGYFPAGQKLFLSFPDSNVTYYLDTRFQDPTWVGPWDFGMTSFYAPADTNIFYFGHSKYKGHIFYYPNGSYIDYLPSASGAINVEYQSGWQSLTDGPWYSKNLISAYFPIQSILPFQIDIFADFDSIAADTFTSADSVAKAYRLNNLAAYGDYFKFKITCAGGQDIIIRPYLITYQESDLREGDR